MELDKLLLDLGRYKTTNVDFHAGDVYAHSIWSYWYVSKMFEDKHPCVEGMTNEQRKLLMAAALLHDIGKGGDHNFTFFDKPNHPEIGGNYMDSGQYKDALGNMIDLRKVVAELGQSKNYNVISFLIRNHWMIGGAIRERVDDTKMPFEKIPMDALRWDVYYQMNLATEVPYDQRGCLFEMLYVIWAADLMATQPFKYPVSDDPLRLGIPPATHPGGNMYAIYRVDEIGLPLRKLVLETYDNPITYPSFNGIFEYRVGGKILVGGIPYSVYVDGNPFMWKQVDMSTVKPKPSSDLPIINTLRKICMDRMKSPFEIPLFKGFPTVVEGLSKPQICELYAAIASSNSKYSNSFYYPIQEDFKSEELPSGQLIYLGRGYAYCEPPNISNSRGLWAFLEKKHAYAYAIGRGDDAKSLDKGFCWNVLTYKTTKQLRLLNLSDPDIRDRVRKDLSNFPCEGWFIREGLFDDKEVPTYADAIDYMFPRDTNPAEPDRVSHTTVDIQVAIALSKVYPKIDGWSIVSEAMDPEIVIFRPFGAVDLINHEYFDASRLRTLMDRCKCPDKIITLFKQGKLICLRYPDDIVKCLLPEEILDRTLVSESEYRTILDEQARGLSVINIV